MRLPESIAKSYTSSNFSQFIAAIEAEGTSPLKIVNQLLKSNSIVFKRRSQSQYIKRRDFFGKMREHELFSNLSCKIEEAERCITSIESIYDEILQELSKCEFEKLSVQSKISAIINRAVENFSMIKAALDKHLESVQTVKFENRHLIKYLNDQEIDPSEAINSLSDFVWISLIMYGHINDLFNSDGVFVAPRYMESSKDEVFKCGSIELYAKIWSAFKEVEENARYLDGGIKDETGRHSELNNKYPTINRVDLYYFNKSIYLLDYIANERYNQQISNTTMHEIFASKKPKGVKEAISIAISNIENILHIDPETDKRKFAGATLLDWIKAYVAIEDIIGNDFIKITTRLDLISKFESIGIHHESAINLFSHLCLSKNSRDLFDCPLIIDGESNVTILGFSGKSVDVAGIITSQFSRLGIKTDFKGTPFENNVRQTFISNGIPCKRVKFSIDGAPYEYDAVAKWGKYLFLIECKCKSISRGNPEGVWHCYEDFTDDLIQISRQVAGYRSNKADFDREFGESTDGLIIIPILANSMPYVLPQEIDGIFSLDFSSLQRFFESKSISIKVGKFFNEKPLMINVPVIRIWDGEAPNADDFFRYISESHQYNLVNSCIEYRLTVLPISQRIAIIYPFLFHKESLIDASLKILNPELQDLINQIGSTSN
ncbi:MAG: hypothetical protein IPN71_18445 [Fibrobacteres bacterium]|nr:hypothetical protein [Fibrobacterota bacterium]